MLHTSLITLEVTAITVQQIGLLFAEHLSQTYVAQESVTKFIKKLLTVLITHEVTAILNILFSK
jgi:hypothetical protein